MVAQMWIDAMSGLATMWGIPVTPMVYIMAIAIAAGITVGVVLKFGKKDLGIASFFLILGMETFMGMFEWIFLIITILPVAYIMYKGGR